MRRISPFIPYIAVAIGLYGLGSAWLAIISYHVGMLMVVLADKRLTSNYQSKKGRLRWWYASVVVFALGGIALYMLWPYALPGSDLVRERLGSCGITKHIWPYFAIYFCLVNSLIEEIFWRGYLMDDSRRPTLHDFAFAGYHALVLMAFADVLWTLPVFFVCVFAAWLWRLMRATTGSITFPIITHFVADVGIAMAVYFRVFA